jgi:hypothetical protein
VVGIEIVHCFLDIEIIIHGDINLPDVEQGGVNLKFVLVRYCFLEKIDVVTPFNFYGENSRLAENIAVEGEL